MANHTRCEECGVKFTLETGREYVMAPGGMMLDVCAKCAKQIEAAK